MSHYGAVVDGPRAWKGWHASYRSGCEQCEVEYGAEGEPAPPQVEWEPDEPERTDYTHWAAYGEESYP